MKARTFGLFGRAEDHEATVAELHWRDGRVVQVSGSEKEDPRGQHLLIQVWPENGTDEYGGSNLTALSLLLVADGGHWQVESLRIDRLSQ